MQSSSKGERVAIVVSAVVAIALLGAAVTAHQSRSSWADEAASLESDLRYQLELSFRDNPRALSARLEAVDRVVADWKKSPQSAKDHRLLIDWLRASIVAAMPRRSGQLPPAPRFGAVQDLQAPAAEVAAPSIEEVFEPPTIAAEDSHRGPAASASASPVGGTPAPAAVADGGEQEASTPTAPAANAGAAAIVQLAPDPPAPVAAPEHDAPSDPPRRVAVNLAELNARIAGYHHDLAGIDANLISVDAATSEELVILVDRMEALWRQYEFVGLYYDALTPMERRAVVELRSPAAAVKTLLLRLDAFEDDEDVLEPFDSHGSGRSALKSRLQAISEKMRDADAATP